MCAPIRNSLPDVNSGYKVPHDQKGETITFDQQQNENSDFYESYTDSSSSKPMVNLFEPIYIAKKKYHDDQSGNFWDAGDEFECLKELSTDKRKLELKHLRTMKTMTVRRSQVEIDDETPLRLGVRDRGIAECCLLK
ncbi:unnamed protein product, partial [Rotaria sp. Silwood2]